MTPYCVKHLGLSENVAANFVRVARKCKSEWSQSVRMEFDLTLEEMKLFRRVQDLVSQKLKKSISSPNIS